MSRLFDRQLLQPEPSSLYDFLQTYQYTDSDSPNAARARTMLARPDAARLAREVRPGGTGWSVREIQGAHAVAAEAVHHRVGQTPAPALFARLRDRSVLPRHTVTFIEAQKLRPPLGHVTAFGWLVTSQPTTDGHALQAYLATEWGRGKLFSPLGACYVALDGQGRYLRERGTDGPAVQLSTPDDPQRPGLLPEILDPVLQSLMSTVGTLLATLAVLNETSQLTETVPDRAQSAAHHRRFGRGLVTYRRIPADNPTLLELFDGPHPTP